MADAEDGVLRPLQSHVRPQMACGRRDSGGEGFLEDRGRPGAAEVKCWVFHPLETGAVGACERVESVDVLVTVAWEV
ncbi:hypothetical protein Celaphus_00009935 [Cervus elaphus hippelaphus]|uniref:Uncharacterized protein n=1 Tax=Cervus elaphus hippelaphus TaxID=46360 RepID=A0A212BZT2_CEREH|nr:hypothetical protein Celaphus_00009935 [Cervus elaphus hippelaphus]